MALQHAPCSLAESPSVVHCVGAEIAFDCLWDGNRCVCVCVCVLLFTYCPCACVFFCICVQQYISGVDIFTFKDVVASIPPSGMDKAFSFEYKEEALDQKVTLPSV